MLTSEQILEKLYRGASQFRQDARTGKSAKAFYAYEAARNIALFMELDDEQLTALFGSRQGDEPVIGLYEEELVLRAQEQCIIHNQTLREITMEEKRRREEEWRKSFERQKFGSETLFTTDKRSRRCPAGHARRA